MPPLPLLAQVPTPCQPPIHPMMPPDTPYWSTTPSRYPLMPLMLPILLLAPEYIHSLPAPMHPHYGPNTPRNPQMPPIPLLANEYLHPLTAPNTSWSPPMPPIPLVDPEYLNSLPALQYTPDTPNGPNSPPVPLLPPIPLLGFNCYFATDGLCTVKMLVFYWSFSIVITLQLTTFTNTSSLQDTIFRCQEYIFSHMKLSQFLQYLPNMHYKHPVAAQH